MTACEDCQQPMPGAVRRRRFCRTCANRRRAEARLCPEPHRTHCLRCGVRFAETHPNRKYCADCRKVVNAESARRSYASYLAVHGPLQHPCVRCGVLITGKARRCETCGRARRSEIERQSRQRTVPARMFRDEPAELIEARIARALWEIRQRGRAEVSVWRASSLVEV